MVPAGHFYVKIQKLLGFRIYPALRLDLNYLVVI